MFTGIINHLGTVKRRTATALEIAAKLPKQRLGASIAVNGVCLTLTSESKLAFDVGPDTWKRTNLGSLKAGQSVNIEPSLRLGDELGGHFVSGHVDAAADVLSLEPWGEGFWRLRVELPESLRGLVAVKGSIAIDGISLTVTSIGAEYFEVMLVPHTLSNTNLGKRRAHDKVNLEADPLARYALAAVEAVRSRT